MSKIYTKTGDEGKTSLVGGSRVEKNDQRINLYGEVDELNSRIGLLVSFMEKKHPESEKTLMKIQNNLFNLGSNLACEEDKRNQFKLPQISSELIKELEISIDLMDKNLSPLKNFILPGGSVASSQCHLCRTSARSVERMLWNYYQGRNQDIPDNAGIFLNRLSDYFFVLSRLINKIEKFKEPEWEK